MIINTFHRILSVLFFLIFSSFYLLCSAQDIIQQIVIDGPSSVEGVYECKPGANWGELTNCTIEGAATFVDDGDPIITDACDNMISNVNGLIAFIDRGACEFGQKALHAENAGAIAVIICNNDTNNPDEVIVMGAGASGGLVTIPVVMMSYNNCQSIRTIAEGGTVELSIISSSHGSLEIKAVD